MFRSLTKRSRGGSRNTHSQSTHRPGNDSRPTMCLLTTTPARSLLPLEIGPLLFPRVAVVRVGGRAADTKGTIFQVLA
jgi:hypothetical protein